MISKKQKQMQSGWDPPILYLAGCGIKRSGYYGSNMLLKASPRGYLEKLEFIWVFTKCRKFKKIAEAFRLNLDEVRYFPRICPPHERRDILVKTRQSSNQWRDKEDGRYYTCKILGWEIQWGIKHLTHAQKWGWGRSWLTNEVIIVS